MRTLHNMAIVTPPVIVVGFVLTKSLFLLPLLHETAKVELRVCHGQWCLPRGARLCCNVLYIEGAGGALGIFISPKSHNKPYSKLRQYLVKPKTLHPKPVNPKRSTGFRDKAI